MERAFDQYQRALHAAVIKTMMVHRSDAMFVQQEILLHSIQANLVRMSDSRFFGSAAYPKLDQARTLLKQQLSADDLSFHRMFYTLLHHPEQYAKPLERLGVYSTDAPWTDLYNKLARNMHSLLLKTPQQHALESVLMQVIPDTKLNKPLAFEWDGQVGWIESAHFNADTQAWDYDVTLEAKIQLPADKHVMKV